MVYMQALFLVYHSIKFFIQAIKKNIVSPRHFCGLCKPLACMKKYEERKIKKTSSTINQKDLSLNFNISEISTILKETSIQEWELFLTCNTECVLLRILNYRLPISSFGLF